MKSSQAHQSFQQVSGAVAQLGEHLLCKQGVVGSIPSGSTIPSFEGGVERSASASLVLRFRGRCRPDPRVLYDIVKRRFVRTPWLECGSRLFRHSADCASMALVCRGETLNLPHMMGLPNRTPGQISRSWSFCANSIESRFCTGSGSSDNPSGIARWALAMRTIKCLKGNWWMPWHAQAMKDVIRCDKLRGGANTL